MRAASSGSILQRLRSKSKIKDALQKLEGQLDDSYKNFTVTSLIELQYAVIPWEASRPCYRLSETAVSYTYALPSESGTSPAALVGSASSSASEEGALIASLVQATDELGFHTFHQYDEDNKLRLYVPSDDRLVKTFLVLAGVTFKLGAQKRLFRMVDDLRLAELGLTLEDGRVYFDIVGSLPPLYGFRRMPLAVDNM